MQIASRFSRTLIAFAALLTLVALACGEDADVPVTVTIQPATATLAFGDTLRFHATVRDRGGAEMPRAELHWTTNDSGVVIDATGLATARYTAAPKTVTVTATVTDKVSASTPVLLITCTACGSWKELPGRLVQSPVIAAIGDKIYLAGGIGPGGVGGTSKSSLFVLDPTAGTWSTLASMPDGRAYASGVAVGGRLYVLGGVILNPSSSTATARSYDPSSNQWTDLPPMPRVRYGGSNSLSVMTVGGKVYAFSNVLSPGFVDIYDPVTNSWTQGADAPTPLGGLGPLAVEGKIYSFTGSSGVMYDPATDTWTSRAPMPSGRARAIGAVLNGKLYAIGGNGTSPQLLEVFDPATNTWVSRPPLPITEQSVAYADTINGKILVGLRMHSAVQLYDPERNAWAIRASMPLPDSISLYGVQNAVSLGGSLVVHMTDFYYAMHLSAARVFTP